MVTVSTPTKASSTRRSLRSSSAKSESATPARKARASHKAQAARPSSRSRSAEETSGAETKIAEPATQKATAEPGRGKEPEKASDNRTGTLVTTVDKNNDLTGGSVAATITGGIADLAGVDSAADASFWSEVASTIPAAERKVRLLCVAALLAAQ